MGNNRREFLKWGLGSCAVAGATTKVTAASAAESAHKAGAVSDEHVGVLVDTTLCIGCRQCEKACNEANHLPPPKTPFSDRFVLLSDRRRPDANAFTVVNGYPGAPSDVQQRECSVTFAKIQCMHCLDPACASACIVGALRKMKEGPVIYEAHKCIGCRYCMVACPFEIPAYEYDDPITPRVRKCTLCVDEKTRKGANPACAGTCPQEAIVFGRRNDLEQVARARIAASPGRYLDKVYGLSEVGGTTWLYLAGREFTELGFPDLPTDAPPRLTEAIQHGIFKYGAAPILLYSGLAALMWLNTRRAGGIDEEEQKSNEPEKQEVGHE